MAGRVSHRTGAGYLALGLIAVLGTVPALAATKQQHAKPVGVDSFNPQKIEEFVAHQDKNGSKDTAESKFAGVASYAAALRTAGQEGTAAWRKALGEGFVDSLAPLSFDGPAEALWQNFFAHAVVLVGNGLAAQPVVAFYNPLVDGVVALQLKTLPDGKNVPQKLTVLTGQALRTLAHQAAPKSTELSAPLLTQYQLTSAAFNKLYPAESRAQTAWAFGKTDLPQSADMLARLSTLQVELYRMMTSAMAQPLKDFRSRMVEGDVPGLRALFPSKSSVPPEWAAALPQQLREELVPVGVYKHGTAVDVVLGTASASRLLIVLQLPVHGSAGAPRFNDITISDYAKLNRSY